MPASAITGTASAPAAGAIRVMAARAEDEPRPRHTPGQAEGVDPESERERPEDDALERDRPSQAEGEDPEDSADEAPPDDD